MQGLYPRLGGIIGEGSDAWEGATWKEKEKRWIFPSGGRIEMGYGENMKEVGRYLGREYTAIFFDELGMLKDEKVWTMLMSRVRSTDTSVPLRMRASANPGGVGHGWIKKRFITMTDAGTRVYTDPETELTRAFIPGKATDNPSLSPSYWKRLNGLPEPMRSYMRDGNWDAGTGLALTLERHVHMVKKFEPLPHWKHFGAFDWGYRHPWVFGWFTVNEDGRVFLVDTVRGQGHLPNEIVERVQSHHVPLERLSYIDAGHDAFDQHVRVSNTPTIAEVLQEHGMRKLRKANNARTLGLNNMREYLSWRGRGPNGTDDDPTFVMMDTPGNQWLFEQLTGIVTDPDDPEDALKVNADWETGEGGDDGYDMLRYGLASRPFKAQGYYMPGTLSAWSPNVLHAESERQRRAQKHVPTKHDSSHPDLGGM